jgi:imidazolonepropionase-like amidohydrolase
VTRSALAALFLLTTAPVAAQTIAVVNGTVATGDGSDPVQGATVVIRDGKVVAAGQGVRVPADARVIDASGKWVTPGIVAGFSSLGLADVSGGAGGANDSRARNGPFSAAIDVVPAINPLYQPIAANRNDGVTRAIVAPDAAKSIFAGQGAVIDTGADMDPITRARVFQYVELGENGAEQAGGSRASAYILFRNALREARELQRYAGPVSASGATPDARNQPTVRNPNESRIYGPDARRSDDVLLTRFDAAALVPVLQGRQYLAVHVERASDILNVLALKREFPSLKIILVGATEGWLVANQIAASGVPVIASPVNDLPESFEQIAATQSNVGRMRAAGVNVSIGMVGDSHMLFNQRQYAGNLVALTKMPGATGLSWGEAFAAITSGPAKAIGMGGQIGSLTPGAHGDVVIWSGDPLDPRTAAEQVYIDGVQQPLQTHQTRLLDRYRYLPRTELPEAYRH